VATEASRLKVEWAMNALLTKPGELKLLGDGATPFTAVVAYDDSLSQSHADRLYSWLIDEFRDEFDFDSRWWSFEQLSQARTAENAASVTKEADMVIISTAGEDLPGHAKLWIETCLAGKGEQDMALVALIGTRSPQRESPVPAYAYLERVAQRAGLSYFASLFHLPEPMPACTLETIQIRADTVTPLLKEILLFPPSLHWGINE
jgi:hypothetical protein